MATIKLRAWRNHPLPAKKAPVPTPEAYYQGYLNTYLVTGVRPSTRLSYEVSFRNHILPELGEIPLDELTRDRSRNSSLISWRKS